MAYGTKKKKAIAKKAIPDKLTRSKRMDEISLEIDERVNFLQEMRKLGNKE